MTDRSVKVSLDLLVTKYIANAARADRSTEKIGRSAAVTDKHVERLSKQVDRLGASLRTLPRSVKVDVRFDSTKVRAELRRIEAAGLKVRAGLDTSTWQREAERAARKIKVDVRSGTRARVDGQIRERDLQRQLNQMHLRVRVHPDVDGGELRPNGPAPARGGGGGGGGGGGSSRAQRLAIRGLAVAAFSPQIVAGLSAATAASTALAGSLGSVAGLAGSLPALFTATGLAAGTIGIGLFGVFDAVKQMQTASDQAPEIAAANTAASRLIVTTRREVSRAAEGVADAERGVTRAQQQATLAQRSLNDAIGEETRRREDLQNRLKSGALSEERALLNIKKAQQDLAKAKRTGDDVAGADLSLREQQQALVELRLERKRDREEAAESARTTVRGSRDVVDAQRAVQDSVQGVTDARLGLRDAQLGLRDAQQASADAVTQSVESQTAAARNLADAMRKLSPEQQRFAKYIFSLKGEFDGLRAAAGRGLLPGLEADIGRSLVLLPTFERALERTGRTLTNLDDGKARFTNPQGIARINTLLMSADGLTGSLGRSGILLGDAFLHVGVAAAPMVKQLGLAAERSSELVLQYAKAKQGSGEMSASFDRIYERSRVLASVLGNVRGALAGTFSVGMDSGDDMLRTLDDLTARWEAWVDSIQGQRALREWFDEGRESMSELGGLIGDLRREFSGLTDDADFSDFVGQIREMVPYAASLVKSFTGSGGLGRDLADALVQIVHALDDMNAGGSLRIAVQTIAGLVSGIAELIQVLPGGEKAVGAFLAAFVAVRVIGGFTGALGRAKGAITPMTVALAVGVAVLGQYQQKKAEAKQATEEFTAAIEADSGALGENTRASVANQLEKRGVLQTAEKLGISLMTLTDATLGDKDAMLVLEQQLAANSGAFRELGTEGLDFLVGLQKTTEAVRKGEQAYKRTQTAVNGLNAALATTPRDIKMRFQALGIEKTTAEVERIAKAIHNLLTSIPGISEAEAVSLVEQERAQGNRVQRAAGGRVWGAGTGTSDSIPARLSNGEYVVKASSSSRYGTAALDAVNEGRARIAYAAGGRVGQETARYAPHIEQTPVFASGGQVGPSYAPRSPAGGGGLSRDDVAGIALALSQLSGRQTTFKVDVHEQMSAAKLIADLQSRESLANLTGGV